MVIIHWLVLYPEYHSEWVDFPENDWFIAKDCFITKSILFINTTTVFVIFWEIHKFIVGGCILALMNRMRRRWWFCFLISSSVSGNSIYHYSDVCNSYNNLLYWVLNHWRWWNYFVVGSAVSSSTTGYSAVVDELFLILGEYFSAVAADLDVNYMEGSSFHFHLILMFSILLL